MKKNLLIGTAVVLLFFQLLSCRKSQENNRSPQNTEIASQAKFSSLTLAQCRIEEIISESAVNPPEVAKFSYNLRNDPTVVVLDDISTDRPNMLFRYDLKHRLTDYIGAYALDSNTSYEFWYNYAHDTLGRIIIDTAYSFGNIVNNIPQPNPMYKSYANYRYDASDRVSSVTRTYVLPNGPPYPVVIDTFTYNSDGNLFRYQSYSPNGQVYFDYIYLNYDDKINMHQANKVWQFIDRNYSRNNPATAEHYNKVGYPLTFKTETPLFFTFAHGIDLHKSVITYRCKE